MDRLLSKDLANLRTFKRFIKKSEIICSTQTYAKCQPISCRWKTDKLSIEKMIMPGKYTLYELKHFSVIYYWFRCRGSKSWQINSRIQGVGINFGK